MDLSIVIPVYNSEKILPHLICEIEKNVNFVKNYEVILVNDCSKDRSWKVIEELSKNNKYVIGINLRINAGQHNAIMAGLRESRGKVVVTMDDDLQHSPKYIKKLYCKISNEGKDVCYTKFKSKKHSLWKNIGSMNLKTSKMKQISKN